MRVDHCGAQRSRTRRDSAGAAAASTLRNQSTAALARRLLTLGSSANHPTRKMPMKTIDTQQLTTMTGGTLHYAPPPCYAMPGRPAYPPYYAPYAPPRWAFGGYPGYAYPGYAYPGYAYPGYAHPGYAGLPPAMRRGWWW